MAWIRLSCVSYSRSAGRSIDRSLWCANSGYFSIYITLILFRSFFLSFFQFHIIASIQPNDAENNYSQCVCLFLGQSNKNTVLLNTLLQHGRGHVHICFVILCLWEIAITFSTESKFFECSNQMKINVLHAAKRTFRTDHNGSWRIWIVNFYISLV